MSVILYLNGALQSVITCTISEKIVVAAVLRLMKTY